MMTFRALGALLTYPGRELIEALPEIADVFESSRLLGRAEKQRIADLMSEMRRADAYELEERYVALFDRGRATSLHLFEHVHGDSRERGQAMVDLGRLYERAGFHLAGSELPDYLPAVLEYLSCRPIAEAREMLGDCAHILRAVGERLAGRGSRYAAVLDAALNAVGESGVDWSKAPPSEPEPAADDDWEEAPAFGPAQPRGARAAVAVMKFVRPLTPSPSSPSPPPLYPSLPTSLPSGERRLEPPFSSWEKGGDEGFEREGSRSPSPLGRRAWDEGSRGKA